MSGLTGLLALVGAVAAAILAAFGYGRRSGAKAVQKDVAAKTAEADLNTRKRIDHAIETGRDAGPDADIDWLRKRAGDQQ